MDQQLISIGQFSLAAILVALIGIWINHRVAIARDTRYKTADQVRKLITTFRPELEALIKTHDDPRIILTHDAFIRHEAAIRDFLPYLSFVSRSSMNKAWRKLAYYENDKKYETPAYIQYASGGDLERRERMRKLAIERIQNVISLVQK